MRIVSRRNPHELLVCLYANIIGVCVYIYTNVHAITSINFIHTYAFTEHSNCSVVSKTSRLRDFSSCSHTILFFWKHLKLKRYDECRKVLANDSTSNIEQLLKLLFKWVNQLFYEPTENKSIEHAISESHFIVLILHHIWIYKFSI